MPENVEYDVEALLRIVLDTMKSLQSAENVTFPSPVELRHTAERYGVRTVYGNYNFVSTVKNRSAWLTVNIGSARDPHFDTMVPRKVNGVQMAKFELSKYYSQEQINMHVEKLKRKELTGLGNLKI